MNVPTLRFRFRDRLFEALQDLDDWLHARGFTPNPICRFVGRREQGYYERNTDWLHPLFVKPSPEFDPDNRRRANENLLVTFNAVWGQVPSQRLGQFVMNLSREPGGFADTWNWSNAQWREKLEEAAKTWAAGE